MVWFRRALTRPALQISHGLHRTGRGPFESGIVRVGRSGRISVYTGAMPMGQGIRTALAQICAEQFNVQPDSPAARGTVHAFESWNCPVHSYSGEEHCICLPMQGSQNMFFTECC